MKRYTIIIIISIGIILGFFTGVYLYKINKINIEQEEYKTAQIEDECTEIAELTENGELDLLRTNGEEEKVSPSCILTLKIYYEKCGHLIEKKEKINQSEVNMKEEEFRKKFEEWELQKFTPTEVVLYKELNEFCDEHYILKEKDGYICIFKVDETNKETLLKTTEISTQYLTEKDLEEIQNGIIIYTEKELNKIIEDFE